MVYQRVTEVLESNVGTLVIIHLLSIYQLFWESLVLSISVEFLGRPPRFWAGNSFWVWGHLGGDGVGNDVAAADEQLGKRIVYPNQACGGRGVVEDDIEPVSLRRLQALAHSFSLISTLPELARP